MMIKWTLIAFLFTIPLEAQSRNRFVKSQETTVQETEVNEIEVLRKSIADLQRQINNSSKSPVDTYEKLLQETKKNSLPACKKAGGKSVSISVSQDSKIIILCNEMK
jgi:hypothetical protein